MPNLKDIIVLFLVLAFLALFGSLLYVGASSERRQAEHKHKLEASCRAAGGVPILDYEYVFCVKEFMPFGKDLK